MAAVGTEMHSGSRGGQTRVFNLDNIDGRTRAAQSLHASISAIEADLGDHLQARDRRVVRRAALAGMMCEDLGARWLLGEPVDPAIYAALANTERSLLESIAVNRRQRPKRQDAHT